MFLFMIACGPTTVPQQSYNTSPSVNLLSPENESEFIVGEEITFTASVYDENQDVTTLTLLWNSDKDGPLWDSETGGILSEDLVSEIDEAGEVTFSVGVLNEGTHVITLNVVDEENSSDNDWVQIEIRP